MKVAVLMGSEKDMPKMEACMDVLDGFNIEHEVHVMSAHRTPERVAEFVSSARDNGFGVIVCGAGKAAHLAGAAAAHSTLPIIGIPIAAGSLGGVDALYATVQMPTGIPVATVAIDGAANAGYLAASILSVGDADLVAKLADYRESLKG
ncbi:MAG: 5-(carboxyamino)imidazole ribonucleotide mutase [Acidimicrobiia bacterium]